MNQDARSESHYNVGLPGSGKSTFLAALWYIAGRKPKPGALYAEQTGGGTEYITDISNRWLEARQLIKTRVEEDARVSILVRESQSQGTVELTFPDISGEEFRAGFTDREWPRSMAEGIRQAVGIVLFIHPYVRKPKSLAATNSALRAVGAAVEAPGADRAVIELPEVEEPEMQFDAKGCPTAVQLVDLLQSVADIRRSHTSTPLTLIISAWDVVTRSDAQLIPSDWLARELPLLDQFLRVRIDLFAPRVIAVSAQGGDVRDPNERTRLLEIDDPRDRIVVCDDQKTDQDLSRIVRLLIQQGGAE